MRNESHSVTNTMGAAERLQFMGMATPISHAASGLADAYSEAARTARRWARAWYTRRATGRTIAALSALDDRQLRDIGLTREDIEEVAGDTTIRRVPFRRGASA